MNGLDYSMGMPSLAAMKQGNVAFVCRYVGWSDLSQAKILTPAEAKLLSQNGIAIVSNYEWYGSRPQEGAAAADVDAERALSIHKSCGGPDTAPIYFSVDYDSDGTDVAEYFKELANKIGLKRVGAYGGYRCIKYLFDHGLISWGWQTYAWSNGQWDNRAHIRQTQNAVQFGGIEVDFDTGMFPDVGQWGVGGTQTLKLNNFDMVLDVAQSYQLVPGFSGDLCCMWAVGSLKFANIPNGGIPAGTSARVQQFAFDEANKYMSNGAVNWPGCMDNDMVNFLHDAGNLHYWWVTPSLDNIRRALLAGYPVIITAYEPNVYSWDGSGWVPAYPWSINANHVFPVVGLDNNGNFICADQLNHSFQGRWPVIYDAARLNPSNAIVVQVMGPDPAHPWLAPIPNGDPQTWPAGFNAQLFGGSSMAVPNGWKDDGTKLISPNGHYAVLGMRNYIEANNWDPTDLLLEEEHTYDPVEESNPSIGRGAAQVSRMHRLEYTSQRGVFPGWLGQEYLFVRADRDAKASALAAALAHIDQLNKEVALLQQQQGGPTNLADIKSKLDAATGAIQTILANVQGIDTEVGGDLPH